MYKYMAKISTNDIRSINEEWTKDPRNNLPYSGRAVQKFIKDELSKSIGASWFDQTNFTLYFFRSNEDKNIFVDDKTRTDLILSSTSLNFSSQMYRIFTTNNNNSLDIQAATNQESLVLSIDFDVQTKVISDSAWISTGDGVRAVAYIDVGSIGQYVEIPNSSVILPAGTTYNIDVREHLQVGSNRIRIVLIDENDESITSSITYSITLAEMYIESFNNTWYNAVVEGDITNYKLGGFKIVGSLSKTLHIEIYAGSSMLLHFQKLIGISSYVDTPYNYTINDGLDLSELSTGVYICKVYLTSGNLTSIPISYNFMYVSESDRLTAKLICVNNQASKVYNYSTSALCDYAIYNSGFSTGDPHIKIQLWSGNTPTTVIDSDYYSITANEIHTLEYTIEWLIEETINLNVYYDIAIGTSSQVGSIPIDNSAVYPAESGADFYMNATTRSNNDSNRTVIVNEAKSPVQYIQAAWQNMAWVDGIDGWTTDPDGRKALLIPAYSKCIIPYKIMSGDNMTFEICFKVSNVSNYLENVITASSNPLSDGFNGIRIKPTLFTIHSAADIDSSKDTIRSKSFEDETVVHLVITIQNSFEGNIGKNLVTGYINGCKTLEFSYDNGIAWEDPGDFIIGSESSDVYVYFCRVYKKTLGVKAVEQNYINSLRSLQERSIANTWFNSILNSNTHELTYEQVVNSPNNYNFFVIEMKDGLSVPSRANNWAKDTKGYSDFEMHFGEHSDWDFKLFGVETSGQGTTSMDYYRWNIRWRIDKTNSDKKIPVSYYDVPSIGTDGKKRYNIRPSSLSKTVYFDGGANNSEQQHPAVMRITAKINQASSMQSHKIGATRAYTILHDAIGLENEAQKYAKENNLPVPTVAVYQYPAFGFSKRVSGMGVVSYEFIGLFTIGPDKGDKPTFGYNISDDIKSNLITLEGTDHSRRMAKFQYPWNNEVEYRSTNECLNIVVSNNQFDNAWEVSNCHGLSTDKASDQSAIQDVLDDEFKPAYEVAWNNSTLIFPIALDDETYGGNDAAEVLANINAEADVFRAGMYNDRFGNADMEFWIEGEYVLYHYDLVSGQYVSGINLVTQNGQPEGSTLEAQNEWFKTQRRNRFKTEAPDYWDIQDSAYHFAYLLIFGATDNFAKNSYPYKMATLENNGRWKWRQDDLDTIFDTDNRGSDSKPYYIEFEDAENGSVVFAGSTSVFWNLLYEVFWNDYGTSKGIESIGKDTVTTMATIGGGANIYTGIINFFKKCFWDNAQNYFPQSAYNIDASWKYELAWLTNGQAVDPLSQSLGRHLEAEHLWCSRRAIYIMSLFKVGAFAQYSDTSLGQIAFRPQSLASITVTPMMWVYPALANGAGSPEATERTEAGEPYTFVGPFGTDGQTTFYIQATNYLNSVGNWKDLRLATQYVDNIDIVGAKLRTFKIGDEEETVTTNVPSLTFNNTKCLEEIDARNAESLSGPIDLSVCTRLKRAYLEGTSITQVTLPSGSKIEELHLSDSTNTLLLKNLKFLTDLELPTDVSSIRTLQVENCTHQDAFSILSQLFNSTDAALQYIRVIFTETEQADAAGVSMLSSIAANKKKDGTSIGYRGINAQGNIEGNPVIEGTVQLSTGLYTDDLENLGVTQTEDWPGGLKRALSSVFGTLYIIYNPSIVYVRFADSAVANIVNTRWGDGSGTTLSQLSAITLIGDAFRGNTNIVSFDELQYFTGLTDFGWNAAAFNGCTSLKTIELPNTINTIGANTFSGCTALERVVFSSQLRTIGDSAFYNCSSLSGRIHLPNLTSIGSRSFESTAIEEITSLGTITTIPWYRTFCNCTSLRTVVLPETLQSINVSAFQGCSNLTTINLPTSITSLWDGCFYGTAITGSVNLPNLITLGTNVFAGTSITSVQSLGSITVVGQYCFRHCTSLTSVILPQTVVTIAFAAFADCTSLTTINLPTSITTIRESAFSGSPITGTINLPNLTVLDTQAFRVTNITSVQNLGSITATTNWSFADCKSLTSVVLPQTLAVVGAYSFLNDTSLAQIISLPTVPPTLREGAIPNNTDLKIYVPYSSDHSILAAYQSSWSSFASKIYELDANGNVPA